MQPISPKKFKEILLVVGILISLLLINFHDVIFFNKTFKVTTIISQALHNGVYGQQFNRPKFLPLNGTDSAILEEPTLEFIKNSLWKGMLPLWNPHQACGFPLIAMLEVGIFFPLNLIVYLLPTVFSWDMLILARFLVAGILTFWFMRRMKFGQIPSLVSAICFMLSGPMCLLQYWTVNVDILLPLLLITLDQLAREPSRRSVAFVSAAVGLTFFAGHPEHIFLVNFYGFVFYVFRFITLLSSPRRRGSKEWIPACAGMTKYVLFSYLLGIAFSAIALFPFLRNFHSEFWNGHPAGAGLLMEEQRSRWITLALPHFFQKVPVTLDWTFAGWWGGYLGILPLALGFLSLFSKQKRGLGYFFFIMAFLFLSKAYGLFFINWVGYLPLFDQCRYAIHTPHLVAFSVAVAAGMGARVFLSQKNIFSKVLLFSIGLALVVLYHFIFLSKTFDHRFAVPATVYALIVLALFQIVAWISDRKRFSRTVIGWVLFVLLSIEMFSYVNRVRPERFDSFGEVPYINYLKERPQRARAYGMFGAFSPNTGSGFGVDDLGVFNGLLLERYVHFVNEFILPDNFARDLRPTSLRDWPPSQDSSPYLDLLNVSHIVMPLTHQMEFIFPRFAKVKNQLKPVYQREVAIYPRQSAFDRAFIVHKAVFAPSQLEVDRRLREFKNDLKDTVIIRHPPIERIIEYLPTGVYPKKDVARIGHYSPNKVVVSALMQTPGFLVLGDAYHPDWQVYVDGEKQKLFEADGLIRAVFLKSGEHKVEFVFVPMSFYLGAVISVLAFLMIVLLYKDVTFVELMEKLRKL